VPQTYRSFHSFSAGDDFLSGCASAVAAQVTAANSAQAHFDYVADWRELRLEREVWRSLDLLNSSRVSQTHRPRFYSSLYSPALTSLKVSS